MVRGGLDHERLQEPGRARVWWRRGTSVTLVGLSGAAVFTATAVVEVALQRRRDRCLSTDRPDAGDRPS